MHSLGNTDRIIMKAEYEQTTLDASGNLWFKHFNQKMDCCHVVIMTWITGDHSYRAVLCVYVPD